MGKKSNKSLVINETKAGNMQSGYILSEVICDNKETITHISLGPRIRFVKKGAIQGFPNLKNVCIPKHTILEIGAISDCPSLLPFLPDLIIKRTGDEAKSITNWKEYRKPLKYPSLAGTTKKANKVPPLQREIHVEKTKVKYKEGFAVTSEYMINNPVLESVIFGANIKRIAKNAFVSCPKLETVSFSSSETKVSEEAFIDCKNLSQESLIEIERHFKSIETPMHQNRSPHLPPVLKGIIGVDCPENTEGLPILGKDEKVVIGNASGCILKKHKIIYRWCKVGLHGKGKGFREVPIVIGFCQTDQKYFLLPEIFSFYLEKYNTHDWTLLLNTQSCSIPLRMEYLTENSFGLRDKSILNLLGYSVSETTGLSQSQRLEIIRFGIENRYTTKAEVESYLHFYISYLGANPNMYRAIGKWENDLRVVHHTNYKIKSRLSNG